MLDMTLLIYNSLYSSERWLCHWSDHTALCRWIRSRY